MKFKMFTLLSDCITIIKTTIKFKRDCFNKIIQLKTTDLYFSMGNFALADIFPFYANLFSVKKLHFFVKKNKKEDDVALL